MGAIVAVLIPVLQLLIAAAPVATEAVQTFAASLAAKGVISAAQLAALAGQENADNAQMNKDVNS